MIFIGLGANLPSQAGQPATTLRAALDLLRDSGGEVAVVSPFYRSVAWPDPTEPAYVNAVANIRTELSPLGLLNVLHAIEGKFGRERHTPNAPRTLDLDILDFDGRIEAGPPILPHPRMASRAFVLVPLRDVKPLWRHPVLDKTVDDLISALPPATPIPERL